MDFVASSQAPPPPEVLGYHWRFGFRAFSSLLVTGIFGFTACKRPNPGLPLPQHFRHCLLVAAIAGVVLTPADAAAADDPSRKLPVEVTADRIEGTTDKEVRAIGNAELRQGDITIGADELKYLNEQIGRAHV